jgi:hypothetical protein
MSQIFHTTDYALLSKQKELLILHVNDMENSLSYETIQALEGIINFIDAFQDEAIEFHDKDEKEVFPNN